MGRDDLVLRHGCLPSPVGDELINARHVYPHEISPTFVGTGFALVALVSVRIGSGFVVYVIEGVQVCFRDINERTHWAHARTRARPKTQAHADLHECSNAHNTRNLTQAHRHTRMRTETHKTDRPRHTHRTRTNHEHGTHAHTCTHTHDTPLARIRHTTCVILTKRC